MGAIKKKPLLATGVGVAVLAIGATIAYNQDSMFFNNLFRLGSDVVIFTEEFESPDDWTPCTETPKVAYATNKNDSVRYARMKIDEYWRTANSQTPASDHTTSDLPLTWSDSGVTKSYAVINTQNENKWVERDGWYYYTLPLQKDDTTDSLLRSVTLNCDANMVESVSYSQNGQTGESVPSAYAGATYHLYVTMELSDVAWDTQRLYDTVASKTRGVDTNVDFSRSSYAAIDNGNGVNTLAAHASDNFPVYYYRGDVNNFVIFNNHCWRIVRTTGTGGTKLLYSGEPDQDSACPALYDSSAIGRVAYSTANLPGYYDMVEVGYMYNDSFSELDYLTHIPYSNNDSYSFSPTVSWDGTTYTLGSLDAPYSDYYKVKTRYYCADGSTSCTTVNYVHETYSTGTGGYFEGVTLSNGDMADTVYDQIYSNDIDSNMKTLVDAWYVSNLSGADSKLEDTVFCNDRTFYTGPLTFSTNDGMTINSSAGRIGLTHTPSVDCANTRDSFTTSAANGNGKLAYKIGLLTGDEVNLAGFAWGFGFNGGYLNDSLSPYDSFLTMSPSYSENVAGIIRWRVGVNNTGQLGHNDGNSTASNTSSSYRPVISLIYDTYVASGSGTAAKPYILEWKNN